MRKRETKFHVGDAMKVKKVIKFAPLVTVGAKVFMFASMVM